MLKLGYFFNEMIMIPDLY